MEPPAPQVSVLMPTRNAQDYIDAALRSVLQETRVPLEVVVVDDGSSDASRERALALGDPRVRIVEGPRRGIAACMNAGLAAARGELLMRCDADDLYPAGRIAEQVDWLARHPGHDAVGGAFGTVDARGAAVVRQLDSGADERLDLEEELRRGVLRTHLCTFAMRRAAVERVAGFREYFETAEDIDFALRLGERGRVAYLPRTWYLYRLHGASITHRQRDVRRLFYMQIAREFQAERLAGGADALQLGQAPAPPADDGSHATSADRHIQDLLVGQAWSELRQRRRVPALEHAWRAATACPLRTSGWETLLKIGASILLGRVGPRVR
jgi:glycosyltransferase involved in cell wall biosynthesis